MDNEAGPEHKVAGLACYTVPLALITILFGCRDFQVTGISSDGILGDVWQRSKPQLFVDNKDPGFDHPPSPLINRHLLMQPLQMVIRTEPMTELAAVLLLTAVVINILCKIPLGMTNIDQMELTQLTLLCN